LYAESGQRRPSNPRKAAQYFTPSAIVCYHSGEGEGLLFYGNTILPFIDRFPKDTELYGIMTTKLSETVKES